MHTPVIVAAGRQSIGGRPGNVLPRRVARPATSGNGCGVSHVNSSARGPGARRRGSRRQRAGDAAFDEAADGWRRVGASVGAVTTEG